IRDFHVTGVQTCALPIFGDYARSQALKSANAEHGAFYEVAVMLGTASEPHNRRASQFAIAAAAAAPGSSPASDLLDSNADLDAGRAASHARILAHAAAVRGEGDRLRV